MLKAKIIDNSFCDKMNRIQLVCMALLFVSYTLPLNMIDVSDAWGVLLSLLIAIIFPVFVNYFGIRPTQGLPVKRI